MCYRSSPIGVIGDGGTRGKKNSRRTIMPYFCFCNGIRCICGRLCHLCPPLPAGISHLQGQCVLLASSSKSTTIGWPLCIFYTYTLGSSPLSIEGKVDTVIWVRLYHLCFPTYTVIVLTASSSSLLPSLPPLDGPYVTSTHINCGHWC